MKQVFRRVLVAGVLLEVLSGCGAGLLTAELTGEARRVITCPCPQDHALHYAILTSREVGVPPASTNPTGFRAVSSSSIGAITKVIDATLKSKDTSTTELTVKTKASGGSQKLANDYVTAFVRVSKP